MARRSTKAVAPGDGRIVDIDVSDEMRASFLEYAYSVIYARALPDARDGLKPVQRRILFQMAQMGLRPERGHVKSARVVGEVMGRLHPHGDSAIYDALVRMAQPFTLRLPMVDGHGNFGSPDDGPAAMRYTEARLAAAALDMTLSLDEDVVDFVPNYDGRETEPTVLPAAIPNLLVNGASGIAVGMATTLVPHNLGEVIGATRYLIKNPKADLGEIMKFIPGPDLPGGGVIIGLAGVREAYESGRGTFRVRARTRIDQVSPRRRGIIVTELPMNVGPERVIERIKDLVQSKKLLGIADVTDLTDGDSGLNLVIDIKNGFHAEAVLENLFKLTPMEESININAVALVEGQPQMLGLLTLLHVFIDHRLEVVRRRSLFRRTKAQDRLHLVDGLLTAILDIDEVIQLIRESDDAAAAKARLIEVFDLSDVQASYILEMPLRRLTKFSRIELEKESDVLKREIEELTKILDNDSELRALVSDELAAIAQAHATPRRTLLMEAGAAPISAAVPLEVDDEPCVVLMSSTGLLARTADQRFEQVGDIARANHDVIISAVPATNRGSIGLVTSTGTLIRLSVVDLPALPSVIGIPALSAGAPIGAFVDLPLGESALCLTTLDETGGIALATANGVVKRVLPDGLTNKDSWEIIRLDEGDQVVGAIGLDEAAAETSELVFVTSDGQLLRFAASA
ncbi:MAG: DNA topoisomerase IV subunit A, partial [Actinomycetes bacterium]